MRTNLTEYKKSFLIKENITDDFFKENYEIYWRKYPQEESKCLFPKNEYMTLEGDGYGFILKRFFHQEYGVNRYFLLTQEEQEDYIEKNTIKFTRMRFVLHNKNYTILK